MAMVLSAAMMCRYGLNLPKVITHVLPRVTQTPGYEPSIVLNMWSKVYIISRRTSFFATNRALQTRKGLASEELAIFMVKWSVDSGGFSGMPKNLSPSVL
jgi:hypothetical protein